ncbi:MAG: pyridoxine 5'-phosphate synthase [Gemmatimonadales bacterium]|jgi:pyridoxine 5-phosphate synthase
MNEPLRLYVNVDHVATVREARKTDEPDPVRAAVLAELGGADGITVHLREDRRHIQDRDVRLLLETVRTGVNLELAAEEGVLRFAEDWRPRQVTFVPERREEVTTEGGLDLEQASGRLLAAVAQMRAQAVRTALFVDAREDVMRASAALGADAVELHTGEYANARTPEGAAAQLTRLHDAAIAAREAGLAVHAGHGLTYENVAPVAAIREVEELNIGHSIVSRSVFVGIERAVREMKEIVTGVRKA